MNSYIMHICISDIAESKEHMKPILNNTKYPKEADINNNKFMTKESMNKYIEECTKEVEKIVLKLMGE